MMELVRGSSSILRHAPLSEPMPFMSRSANSGHLKKTRRSGKPSTYQFVRPATKGGYLRVARFFERPIGAMR